MLKRLTAPLVSLLLGAALTMVNHPARAEVLVVVSAEAPFTRLTRSDLRDIYLGRRTLIASGVQVEPLDQVEGTAARSEFYFHYTGQTPAQIKAHWAKQIFTGRGQPPQTLTNSRAMVERLVSDAKALGYIDPSFLDERLRVVTIE
ncbi:phosphate ABC transporter substrate-binding protein [Halovibrio sp. HP20-50]|uniref:phosphate ABC transporter substrate-binding protein n=1 Tax=Halovibrio sp. HP20-59 TaxID=3080275 RepID=UPI00294B89FA|nr:phosphate ABC transporter substrate-binding protein [Halovibrio sp. HP20-59]MEA2118422.1 phosphate ABC transporter substrate-binding protein [Halovibrio sp. HP20-59]